MDDKVKKNGKDWRRWSYILLMLSVIEFLILSSIAMYFYPGGTNADNNTSGYDFFLNYYSDLGRFRAFNGERNQVSFWLFNISIIVFGISSAVYFVALREFFQDSIKEQKYSKLGTMMGVVSGCCLSCVGFLPDDILHDPHIYFTVSGFVLAFFTALAYIAAISFSERVPKKMALVFKIFVVIFVVYFVVLAVEFIISLSYEGDTRANPLGLAMIATGQKSLVYSWLGCFFLLGYHSLKLSHS